MSVLKSEDELVQTSFHKTTVKAEQTGRKMGRFFKYYQGRQKLWGLAFVLPAILMLSLFNLYPMANAFYLSFFSYDLYTPPEFFGLGNYSFLATNELYLSSFRITLVYVFGSCIPIWFISFFLAVGFNRKFRFRTFFLVIYFTPVVMALVPVSIVWKALYNSQGPINQLFGWDVPWLTSSRYSLLALIILTVWKSIGYYMLLYLAGLRNISTDYYEAAALDGASPWQRLRYITVPLMYPTITFVVIISIVIAFKVFVPMYVMTLGGPNNSTQVLTYGIYETAFRFNRMGRAAAESVVLFVFLMLFSLVQIRLFRSRR